MTARLSQQAAGSCKEGSRAAAAAAHCDTPGVLLCGLGLEACGMVGDAR